MLDPTKDQVLAAYQKYEGKSEAMLEKKLIRVSGYNFHHSLSPL